MLWKTFLSWLTKMSMSHCVWFMKHCVDFFLVRYKWHSFLGSLQSTSLLLFYLVLYTDVFIVFGVCCVGTASCFLMLNVFQIVIVSPCFLTHIAGHGNSELGQVFRPEKVLALLLGVDDSQLSMAHLSGMFWASI